MNRCPRAMAVATLVGLPTPWAAAAVLVVNVDRHGLSLGELATLLHGFGHALRMLLSTTRHASQGGTDVKPDFVEAPSQMFGGWVCAAQALKRFGKVCAACEPVSDAWIAKARAARRVGRRHRATVLANGAQFAPDDLLREFLGRPGDRKAFFHFLSEP